MSALERDPHRLLYCSLTSLQQTSLHVSSLVPLKGRCIHWKKITFFSMRSFHVPILPQLMRIFTGVPPPTRSSELLLTWRFPRVCHDGEHARRGSGGRGESRSVARGRTGKGSVKDAGHAGIIQSM